MAGSTNVAALEVTLSELDRLGRIGDKQAATVQALRSMAAALDDEPARATLWKQYREALGELMADDADPDPDADGLFTEVGDTSAS